MVSFYHVSIPKSTTLPNPVLSLSVAITTPWILLLLYGIYYSFKLASVTMTSPVFLFRIKGYNSDVSPVLTTSSWLSRLELRLRACVNRNISGSSPDLYTLLFISNICRVLYDFILLFSLLVLRTDLRYGQNKKMQSIK